MTEQFLEQQQAYSKDLATKTSLVAIDDEFNQGKPFNLEVQLLLLKNEAEHFEKSRQMTIEYFYRLANRLLYFKKNNQLKAGCESLSLGRSKAYQMINVVEKTDQKDLKRMQKLIETNVTAFFELMRLDQEDQLDALEAGETVGGISLYAIEQKDLKAKEVAKLVTEIKGLNNSRTHLKQQLNDQKSRMKAQQRIANQQSIERGKLEQEVETLKIEKENALKPSEETDNKKMIELNIAVSRVAGTAMDEILKLDEFRDQIQMLNAKDIEENPQYQRLQSTCLDSAKIILTSAANLFDELEALFGEDFSIQDENFRTIIATLNAKINLPE